MNVGFWVFENKSPELSNARSKINSSLDLHVLISYLDLPQTYASTNFRFKLNSYINVVMSKTQKNSLLKTRHLKGITVDQLFIIFKTKFQNSLIFI